jgi:hypothetical protein
MYVEIKLLFAPLFLLQPVVQVRIILTWFYSLSPVKYLYVTLQQAPNTDILRLLTSEARGRAYVFHVGFVMEEKWH